MNLRHRRDMDDLLSHKRRLRRAILWLTPSFIFLFIYSIILLIWVRRYIPSPWESGSSKHGHEVIVMSLLVLVSAIKVISSSWSGIRPSRISVMINMFIDLYLL